MNYRVKPYLNSFSSKGKEGCGDSCIFSNVYRPWSLETLAQKVLGYIWVEGMHTSSATEDFTD